MIRIRIDVDYPYPSRARSFVYTAFGIRAGSDYLKNSKIVARMINESPREVRAYWFFTPKTIPDKQLLDLLNNGRHEIGLHIANNPYSELKLLRESTGRKIEYYTIHGTSRLIARIMWKRFTVKTPDVPEGFPLKSFHQFPTFGLDIYCHYHGTKQAVEVVNKQIEEGKVLHIHPIWLFQRGRLNHRGPYYETLRTILEVDKDLETLGVNKKSFFKVARDVREYQINVVPTEKLIEKLRDRGVDILTFIERKWCHTLTEHPESWAKTDDNIALLKVTSYDEWWKKIGKKTRNMIRKAQKSGIETEIAEPNEKFAEGIWKIYNETPIRQERAFPHYGISLQMVKKDLLSEQNCTYIGAYLHEQLVGFVQLIHGDNVCIISQILSFQKHWDKAINNALVAKTIEVCANRHEAWIIYGRMGNHPTLDTFKQSNGFIRFSLARYYIPLTRKGKSAIRLGLHRELRDALPQAMKYPLFPVYNWVSRTNARIKLRLRPK